MTRVEQLNDFTAYDGRKNFIIEPETRRAAVEERLLAVIREYNPSTIVKAGIGEGSLLISMARNHEGCIVAVDQSLARVQGFIERFGDDSSAKKIRFIVGDFQDLPVDYYKADLLVCVDYLNLVDSGRSVDEFRRALQFEGILFLGTVVLHNDDVEGVYDDYTRLLFPLHNDYYLENDLKTFLELKDFRFVKAAVLNFPRRLEDEVEFFEKYSREKLAEQARAFIADSGEVLRRLYGLSGDAGLREPYFVGYFARKKPE